MHDSLYRLQHHLNTHSTEDEIRSGITKDDVREIVKRLVQGIEWGMFLN